MKGVFTKEDELREQLGLWRFLVLNQAFKDEYLTRPIPYDWAQTLRNIIAQNPGYDY